MSNLLHVDSLGYDINKTRNVFSDLTFDVNEGDVIVLQGKSGAGKSTLLKCLAHLIEYKGEVRYRGSQPRAIGVPSYRTKVAYVPQRPSLLPGTPHDFLKALSGFSSRTKCAKRSKATRDYADYVQIGKAWGVDEELWSRNWSNLSGGESQRISLAIAVGLDTAEVLLLDEPTSALDPNSTNLVERFLLDEMASSESELKAIVWVTHSDEQAQRVGTRFLRITQTGCEEERGYVEP
ncbi:ATP-binding cassette transporter [Coniophora puteana RWD-64-598 SS2]|uniref:ATP-binding cassette transporter n=1 Tax=Coniophora puteana (strain RWD-64-598) TaxID=741705 RepID=A0A5M3N3K7_CONPW|nr:ATP-binding cassette transporter [Coniophora puteana RWD-64-598 SS2]EIW85887.1 ATP-binding cassette transporter [Coniophora puteana RWD-64-598 SS2]